MPGTETAAQTTANEQSKASDEQQPKPFTLDQVEKRYFPPTEEGMADAQNYAAKVASVTPQGALRMNFTPKDQGGEGIPEGFGLLIMPIQKRMEVNGEGKNVVVGSAICAIPDPATVAANEKGVEYIKQALIDDFANRLSNAVRPRGDDNRTAATLPTTLEHFLERGRRGESLKSYTELAGDMVKALKKLGLKTMNSVMLRQILSSQEFAEEAFPKVPQEKWKQILQKFVALANEKSLDPAIFIHWRDTREQTAIEAADDFDFEELEGLVK